MNKTTAYYGIMAIGLLDGIASKNDEWKKQILIQWKDSAKLPRKKKKLERKSLLLDWSIARWNPYSGF